MANREENSPEAGLIIRGNVCIGNSGAGISVPARFVRLLDGNVSANNPGVGIKLTDEYTTLLDCMRLRRDTPPAVLASAVASLRDVLLEDETTTHAAIDGAGLTKWISPEVQSWVQFAANILAVANSAQGQAVLGKLLG